MKHTDTQDGVLLWVERNDEGNITDWEMAFKRDVLIIIPTNAIAKLKKDEKQIPAERYEGLIQHLFKEKQHTKANQKRNKSLIEEHSPASFSCVRHSDH